MRRLIRNFLGWNSLPYRLISEAFNLYFCIFKGGFSGLRMALMQCNCSFRGFINIKSLNYPLFIRAGTDDVGAVINNIFREEYGQFNEPLVPGFIVDAGAYIGDTSAYFLSRFPNARVVSLEPNPESYDISKLNLAPYGARVELLNQALTSVDCEVFISGSETGHDCQMKELW